MAHKYIALFRLGQVEATPGVIDGINEDERISALTRHHGGDWGDVCEDDWESNNDALESGGRLLSTFKSKDGVPFWIITESDRRVTKFLLPEEY